MRRWTPGHRAGVGTTAEVGVCAGYGALPVLSAGDAADYRGHDTRRGHPDDPPASATGSRPAPDRSGACPPGRLCLVLRLTAPGGSLHRPRQPSSGPEPEVAPHAAREWGGEGGPASCVHPQPIPRFPWWSPSRLRGVLHAYTRVHPSLLCTLSQLSPSSRGPSAAPPALPALSIRQRVWQT